MYRYICENSEIFECRVRFSLKYPIAYLVTPLVDDRHVDVINKDGHLLACWRAICGTHPLV